MTGDHLNRTQASLGLDDAALLELLNGALDRRYERPRLREWKDGRRAVPKNVAAFLEQLTLERGIGIIGAEEPDGDLDETVQQLLREEAGEQDAPPADPGSGKAKVQLIPGGRGAYTKVCTELWQIVGTGVTTTGALAGSPVIQADGQIIYGDSETLGQAWGKLAEQNEVLARWLMQAATGGAWLEVVLATGGTAMKLMQNHALYAQARKETDDDSAVA